MQDTRQFYESYWRWRHKQHLLNAEARERIHAALRLMNQADEPAQRVLDVGCGEGGLGHLLRERHGTRLHLVGVDIAAAALALAEQHYDRVHLVNLDQERLADHVGPQRFDVIVMLETLEHLFKPQAALVQLRDHLAPGGQMIASFPNIAWWRYRLKMLAGQFPEDYHIFDAVEHLQHFTLPTFQRLLTQSGYRVAAIDGEFLQPVGIRHLPRPLRRVLNNRLPNLFGYQIVVRAIPC